MQCSSKVPVAIVSACIVIALLSPLPARAAVDASATVASEPSRPAAAEQDVPHWEWGLGVAAAWLRDYPGSRHYGAYGLPYPWFTWRSDRIQVGREGTRGILWRGNGIALDAVLNANPPADPGDNPERAGMATLHALVEPGLRLRWRAWDSQDGRWRLDLRLPVRMSYMVYNGGFHALGRRIEPGLSIERRLNGPWSWSASTAATFADGSYQDYFYGVDAAEVTPTRPAYEAAGGFGGLQAGLRLSWRGAESRAGVFVRIESLHGASFADSPLVSTPVGITAGLNWSRRFGASRRVVDSDEPWSIR